MKTIVLKNPHDNDTSLRPDSKKQKTIHNTNRCDRSLFELCQNHDYITEFPAAAMSELKKLLAIHPLSAMKKDTFGRTPLFHALKHGKPPPSFIKLLYEAYPDALLKHDCSGMNALQMVCLQSYPPYLLATILELQPTVVFTTDSVWQDVVIPWVHFIKRSKECFKIMKRNSDAKEQWEKLIIVLKTMFLVKNLESDHEFLELHAAIELEIPLTVIAFMVHFHADQVSIPLMNGKLPLHMILEKYFMNGTNSECDHDGKLFLLRQLLEAYKKAASIPYHSYGKQLPLHALLQHGNCFTDGVEELVYAYPDALMIPDVNGLLPFMIAALKNEDAKKAIDINTIYILLTKNPSCCQLMH